MASVSPHLMVPTEHPRPVSLPLIPGNQLADPAGFFGDHPG